MSVEIYSAALFFCDEALSAWECAASFASTCTGPSLPWCADSAGQVRSIKSLPLVTAYGIYRAYTRRWRSHVSCLLTGAACTSCVQNKGLNTPVELDLYHFSFGGLLTYQAGFRDEVCCTKSPEAELETPNRATPLRR